MPNSTNRIAVLVFVLAALVGLVPACSSPTPIATPVPPSPEPTVNATATAIAQPTLATDGTSVAPVQFEEGKDLVAQNCTGCHTLDRISSTRKTREEWLATIDKMITT